MKNWLLFSFLLLSFLKNNLSAQVVPPCPVPPPPGAESCQTACVNCNFDGYSGTNNGTPSGGDPVCDGQIFLHNDQWFGFVAGSASITINVLTANCQNGDGLQAAFFDGCPPGSDAIFCNPGQDFGGGVPLPLTYGGFVPGQVYFFMIDGYSNDVCDFTVDVTSGSVMAPPPVAAPPPIGPSQVCPGAIVQYTVPESFGANAYIWTAPAGSSINGAGNSLNVAAPDGNTVTITFGNTGGQVCVRPNNPCFPGTTTCRPVTMVPIPPTTLPDITICFEELPYEPPFENAPPVTTSGVFIVQTNPPLDSYISCDSTVKQKVTVKPPLFHNDGIKYVCQGSCYNFNNNSFCTTGGPFAEKLTSPSGCDSTVTFNVVIIQANAVISPANPTISCGSPTITLSASGSTTGGGVVYTWTNAAWAVLGTGATYQAGAGGVYHLILRNNISNVYCSDTATVTVMTSAAIPGATAIGGTIGCTNSVVTLQGSSNLSTVTWAWSGPGINASNQNLQNPPVNVPGSYTLVVTNTAGGCTSTANAMVIGNTAPPGATAVGDTINCTMPSAMLNGGSPISPVSFAWSGPNSFASTSEDPTVNAPGVYILLVTNPANGCTSTASATVISQTTLPTVSAGTDKNLTCTVTSVTLNGSASAPGGVVYFWLGPGISGANQTIANPSVTQPGEYILTATDPISSCKKSDTTYVLSNIQSPTLNPGVNPVLNCDSSSVTLLIGCQQCTGFGYAWTGPGITAANQNQPAPKVSVPGVYNLVVTNPNNGCTAMEPLTVSTNLTPPSAMAAANGIISCVSTSVLLDASGTSIGAGIIFFWTGPGIGANNQNSATPTVSQPGLYNLLVTNSNNGCTASDTTVVLQDANVPVANAGADQTLKCGVASVSLDGSGSSSGANISASWAGPGGFMSNLYMPTGLTQSGNYTLTIKNSANSCEISDIVVVVLDTVKPSAKAGLDQILNCKNLNSVTLNGSGSSSGANFSFAWSGPKTGATANLTTSLSGIYTLTVFNSTNDCSATDQVSVADLTALPVANAGADLVIDCNSTSVTILSGTSANGANITYSWLGAGITAANKSQKTPTVSLPGIYEITVKDTATGCQSIDQMEISLDAGKPTAKADLDKTLTCAAPTAILDGSASSAGANLTATWTGPSITVPNQNLVSQTVSLPGLYIISIANSQNGCQTADSVRVFEKKTFPTAKAGADQILNCGITQVILDGALSSSIDTSAFAWTGAGISGANATQKSPTVNLPGNYIITVTHTTSGCTATDNVTITIDTVRPIAAAGLDQELTCTITSVTLDGTGSSAGLLFLFTWTGPGISPVNQNQKSPTVGGDGIYNLLLTNTQNKCTATDQVLVTLNGDFPLTNAGLDGQVSCKNDTIILDGSGSLAGAGITYKWTGPGIVAGNSTLIMPQIFQPGQYTLLVSNANNGCSKSDVVNVTGDFMPPFVDAGTPQTITCQTTNGVTLSSAGSFSGPTAVLLWSGPGITAANESQPNPTVLQPGDYKLIIQNTTNGCTGEDDVIVFQDQNLPTASAGLDKTITCAVTSVVLDGSGSSGGNGITYKWTGPGITPANATQKSPTVSAVGNYAITVTNPSTGCTAEESVTVLDDTTPPVFTTTTVLLTCTMPTGQISAICADVLATYQWSGPSVVVGDETKSNPKVSDAGTYKVIVKGGNGCTATANVLVTDDGQTPNGSTKGDTLNCYNNGMGQVSVTSTTTNLTYLWTGPGGVTGTNATLDVTAPGNYSVKLTATNGCSKTLIAKVLDDRTLPNAVATVIQKLDCNTAEIDLNGAGSSVGNEFMYQWTTTNGSIAAGQNALSAVASKAGNYSILVTDQSNGCTKTATVAVEIDPAVPAGFFIQKQNILCFGEINGLISIDSIDGGTQPFAITFNGNTSASQNFSGLPAGIYPIRLEDANGCQIDTVISITEPADILVDLGPDLELFLGESVEVKGTTNLAHGLIKSITWTPSIDCDSCLEKTVTPIRSVKYTLTLVDTFGCSDRDDLNVKVIAAKDIYVPTAFAPNSNSNNLFTIFGGRAVSSIAEFRVFDRWGELVYERNKFAPFDPTIGWDGQTRSKLAQIGVYVWYAKVLFADGTNAIYKGDVTLSR